MIFNIHEFNVIEIQSTFKLILVESKLKKAQYPYGYGVGGWGNGYVCLPDWHPLFNVHYDNIYVNVYGGLTFSEYDPQSKHWIIGFDTNHSSRKIIYDDVLKETLELEKQCLSVYGVQQKLRQIKLEKLLKNERNHR